MNAYQFLNRLLLAAFFFTTLPLVSDITYKPYKETFDAVKSQLVKEKEEEAAKVGERNEHLLSALTALSTQAEERNLAKGMRELDRLSSPSLWEDLQLYNIDVSESATAFVNTLDRIAHTKTTMGYVQLAGMLAQSIALQTQDSAPALHQELLNRQNFIKKLIHDTKFSNELSQRLNAIKSDEAGMLKFFRYKDEYLIAIFARSYNPSCFPYGSLRHKPWLKQIIGILEQKIAPLMMIAFAIKLLPYISATKLISIAKTLYSDRERFVTTLKSTHPLTYLTQISPRMYLFACFTLLVRFSAIKDKIKQVNAHDSYLFERAKGLALVLRTFSFLLVNLSKIDSTTLPRSIAQSLEMLNTNMTQEESELCKLAEYKVFDQEHGHKPSNYFGAVRRFAGLARRNQEFVTKCACFVAEADAYLSMAELVTSQADNNKNQFCFTKFLKPTNITTLTGKNFWNMTIGQKEAIPSSIEFGPGKTHNIMLTGLNAGGKSSVTKAIILNIILSQSFGIAAAESWEMTPFASILSHLSSRDNTAAGKSHFMMEAESATKIKESAEYFKSQDLAVFVATDELIQGTNNKAAVKILKDFHQQVGSLENVIGVFSTHHQELTELAERSNAVFSNYRMSGYIDSNNNVHYTYKLEPGINTLNIADHIYAQAQKNGDLLAQAAALGL